jgi:hypothetical protein
LVRARRRIDADRASFRSGEIRILDLSGDVERSLSLYFDDRGVDLRLPSILNGK